LRQTESKEVEKVINTGANEDAVANWWNTELYRELGLNIYTIPQVMSYMFLLPSS